MTFSLDIDTLPTLPTIVLQVLEEMNDPESSIKDIADIISKDPSISAKILKLVNSAFYGFPKRIGTISHAISILGLSTIKSLIMGVAVLDSFKVQEFDLISFWEHSLKTAALCSHLSEIWNFKQKNEAFTLGLVHDMGKLVFMLKAPDMYKQVLQEVELERQQRPIVDIERQYFKMDHAFAGAHLARMWNFPTAYVHAIESHHRMSSLDSGEPSLKQIVFVANWVINILEEQAESGIDLAFFEEWGLDYTSLQAFVQRNEVEIQDFLRAISP